MTLCVHQVSVFYGIPIRSNLAVKLRIFQCQFLAAMSTLAALLAAFEGFELGTNAGLASLIVSKFLNYFSAVRKEQERVVSRQPRQPFPNVCQQFIGEL